MKPQIRFYNHARAAKFQVGDNKVVLRKPDQFQLTVYENRVVVVKDGFRYPVSPTLVRELVKRSSLAKPESQYTRELNQFNVFGHTFLKYVVLQASKLGEDVVSGFKDGLVFAQFQYRLDEGEITCILSIRQNSLYCAVYSARPLNIQSVAVYAELVRALKRIGQRMTEKLDVVVEKYRPMHAVVANIKVPWGTFSGHVYYTVAKWDVIN